MGSETTHPSLLARVRDPADAAAWREFEARYRDLIRRYCRRRGLQQADAEDVGQVVFLALSRALGSFRFDPARGRFRDYLGRVVQNAISRHAQRPRRPADLLDTSVLEALIPAADPTPDEPWEREWMLHHYRLAMHAVRAECQPDTLAVFERLVAGEPHGTGLPHRSCRGAFRPRRASARLGGWAPRRRIPRSSPVFATLRTPPPGASSRPATAT